MNTNNDFFDEAEEVGHILFTQLATNKPEIKPYKFTVAGSAEDLKMLSGISYMMAEIKVRKDLTVEDSIKYGPFCEFMKWDGMRRKALKIERKKKIKIDLVYINFLKDGCVIYKLEDIEKAKFFWKMLPESSVDKTLINKYVTLLRNPIEILKN